LPLRDVRAGLGAIGSELEEVEHGLVRLAARATVGEIPPPRLLGAFDPVLLGWTSRDSIVGRHGDRIASGGLFRPFALVEGRAVGLWKWAGNEVGLEPLERLSREAAAGLEDEAADVARFLGTA
jgi:hypothetical protein